MNRMSVVISVAFILAAAGVFYLLMQPDLLAGSGRECVTYFEDAQLLEKGNPVAVAGIVVGKVENLEPFPTEEGFKVRVVWTVDEQLLPEIGQHSTIHIGQKSFLGNKFLDLRPKRGGDVPTEDRDDGEPLLVINAGDSTDLFKMVEQLKDKATELIDKIIQTLDQVQMELLHPDKVQKIWALLDNADQTITGVRQNLDTVMQRVVTNEDSTLANVDALVIDLRAFVADLRGHTSELSTKLQGTLGNADVLLGSGNDAVNNLDQLLQDRIGPDIARVAQRAEKILETLDERLPPTVDNVNSVLDNANGLLTNPELFNVLYEMRYALQEFRLLMTSLRANPAQVIFGGPGEVESSVPEHRDERKQRTSGRAKRYGY